MLQKTIRNTTAKGNGRSPRTVSRRVLIFPAPGLCEETTVEGGRLDAMHPLEKHAKPKWSEEVRGAVHVRLAKLDPAGLIQVLRNATTPTRPFPVEEGNSETPGRQIAGRPLFGWGSSLYRGSDAVGPARRCSPPPLLSVAGCFSCSCSIWSVVWPRPSSPLHYVCILNTLGTLRLPSYIQRGKPSRHYPHSVTHEHVRNAS